MVTMPRKQFDMATSAGELGDEQQNPRGTPLKAMAEASPEGTGAELGRVQTAVAITGTRKRFVAPTRMDEVAWMEYHKFLRELAGPMVRAPRSRRGVIKSRTMVAAM